MPSNRDRKTRRTFLRPILAGGLLCVVALTLSSETLKLTTTYPSPVGIYNYIITTGDAGTIPQNTILARNAGKVGIGTATPQAELDVNGGIHTGSASSGAACSGNAEGTFAYDTSAHAPIYCAQTGRWAPLGRVPPVCVGFNALQFDGTNYRCANMASALAASSYVTTRIGSRGVPSCAVANTTTGGCSCQTGTAAHLFAAGITTNSYPEDSYICY